MCVRLLSLSIVPKVPPRRSFSASLLFVAESVLFAFFVSKQFSLFYYIHSLIPEHRPEKRPCVHSLSPPPPFLSCPWPVSQYFWLFGAIRSLCSYSTLPSQPRAATEWVRRGVHKTSFIRTGSEGHGLPAVGLNHCCAETFACLPVCISALVWNQFIITAMGQRGH